LYDYYKILGVKPNASSEEIKKAFRTKAKQFHPDVNNSPKAQEYFTLLNEAHSALTDDTKKYLHDLKLKYGKEQTQSGPIQNNTNSKRGPYAKFHYDWDSFRTVQNKRKKENEVHRPVIYNLFFISGMSAGLLICFTLINCVLYGKLPFVALFLVFGGLILIRDGWQGIGGKKNNLHTWVLKKIRKIFS